MNLIFRFIWTMLRAWYGRAVHGPVGLFAEVSYRFRCMPTDLDVNMHMTNSRYASFMDIVRIAMMVRNGAWANIRAAKLFPVLGSNAMRFRRAVNPFQRFTVTAQTIGWDHKFIYIGHKLLVDGDVAAVAIAKAAFIGPQGRIDTYDLIKIMGYDGPELPPNEMIERAKALDEALKA
ncbi:MAG: thioesterase family protein [Rhodospirillaceae bacterium]|nr:thioesterase family protein [Rhodospirillaceae bacterium]